jgi:hypothetical protein
MYIILYLTLPFAFSNGSLKPKLYLCARVKDREKKYKGPEFAGLRNVFPNP